MKSILLTILQKYDLVAPPAAIGVLQGVAKDHGLETSIFDFNLYLNKTLSKEEWFELDNWCIFIQHKISKSLEQKILKLWDEEITKRLPAGCEYLLISIFSYWHYLERDFDHAGFVETSIMLAISNNVKKDCLPIVA